MDNYIQLTLFSLLLESCMGVGYDEAELLDYCADDGFHAGCVDGEILLMQEAFYGRMEFGTCVKYAVGMNCRSDVLGFMDSWCSGQETCQVNIFDFAQLTDECPSELIGYLQVRYTCLQVVNIGEQCCSLPGERITLPMNKQHMASSVMSETVCGDAACPLVIQAAAGQQINVSIYNFNISSIALPHNTHAERNRLSNRCAVHVNIKEEGIGITVALCVDDVRKRHVYTSSTNEVEIRVVTDEGKGASRFLFYFEALGCPDPDPPEHTYVDRNGQHVFIRCKSFNDVMWEITCRNNQWQGEIGNCSKGAFDIGDTGKTDIEADGTMPFNKVVILAVIISLAVLISVGIILIGIACIKRQRCSHETHLHHSLAPHTRSNFGKPFCSSQTLERRFYTDDQNIEISYPQPFLPAYSSRNDLTNEPENRLCKLSTFPSNNSIRNIKHDPTKPKDWQNGNDITPT